MPNVARLVGMFCDASGDNIPDGLRGRRFHPPDSSRLRRCRRRGQPPHVEALPEFGGILGRQPEAGNRIQPLYLCRLWMTSSIIIEISPTRLHPWSPSCVSYGRRRQTMGTRWRTGATRSCWSRRGASTCYARQSSRPSGAYST